MKKDHLYVLQDIYTKARYTIKIIYTTSLNTKQNQK